MLTGPDLLAKVKELGQVPRDQIAIACGYVNAKGKPAFTAFFEALNAAHGLVLPPVAAKPKKGKPLAWNVAVSKTGVIPVSAGYSTLLGLEPGDRVDIAHDAATGTLTLRKAAAVVAEAAPVVVTSLADAQGADEDDDEIVITAPAAKERELAPF
jgi:hypothetical protein